MSIEISYKIGRNSFRSHQLENDDYKIDKIIDGDRVSFRIHAKKKIKLSSFVHKIDFVYHKKDRILVNGYQSWTDTKEFYPGESIKKIKMPHLITDIYKFKSYGDYTFKNTKRGVLHGYTYSYIKGKNGDYFIGSFNERQAYLIINHDVKRNKLILESECKGVVLENNSFTLLDYCFKEGVARDLEKEYFSNFKVRENKKIKGYTSWYNDYQNISEKKIMYALDGIDSTRYDLFQIDDGYEKHVGDWCNVDHRKFPNGLEGIVAKIHQKGLLAGIWLAPFVVELNSEFYKKHNDLCYKERGKDVFAGGNWSKFVPLDINKPEAIDYIKKCLKFHLDLGFDFFKLDFLYAAALVKVPGRTKAQVMSMMMDLIRDVLGDKLILGCGVPLSSAFGVVDYCRIGPDVSLKFDDVFYMRFAHRERISTKVTLQNTLYRSSMDGLVFRNDPDVYLLRDDNIKLNQGQKKALLTINTLCGSVYFTSDNVKDYSEKKLKLLDEVEPLSNATIISIDRENELIKVRYSLEDGDEKVLVYNTEKGVIVHG